ncbi:hypothetical protein HFU84_08700 [Acidithiobacillus sp. CV18-2]|nr:hypothetical protein [Acidithiobacillus sp. CV18-3]MBU2756971.1 hypothetical protein [Acidithiobacillus sp. BN09-2]MBU2777582.1 hypothetical protein [Acidithiobacillus sp. CV18-2]MBU2799682.1 hypothetical protein [Acidithiobacillus sp. VAN18-4]
MDDGIALKGGASGFGSRFTFRILNDGPSQGREINHLLNVGTTHADNRKYSLQELAGMLVSSGVPSDKIMGKQIDTQWALGRKMSIVLGPQDNNPQYVEVKGYMESGARHDKANWDKVRDKIEGKPAGHGPSMGNAGGSWGYDNGGAAPAQAAATPPVMPQGGGFAQNQPAAPQGGGFAQSQPVASSQQPQPQNTWGSSGGFAGPS